MVHSRAIHRELTVGDPTVRIRMSSTTPRSLDHVHPLKLLSRQRTDQGSAPSRHAGMIVTKEGR